MNTRRQFLITAPLGRVATTLACGGGGQPSALPSAPLRSSPPPTPGAPPTFGTAPGAGPAVHLR